MNFRVDFLLRVYVSENSHSAGHQLNAPTKTHILKLGRAKSLPPPTTVTRTNGAT